MAKFGKNISATTLIHYEYLYSSVNKDFNKCVTRNCINRFPYYRHIPPPTLQELHTGILHTRILCILILFHFYMK